MIDYKSLYYKDVGFISFLLYCTSLSSNENICVVHTDKIREDLKLSESEFLRLMKKVNTEEVGETNADQILKQQENRFVIKFDKSFTSEFQRVKRAEKERVNVMLKRINKNTFTFCGTLTEREKELKKYLEDYISETPSEKKRKINIDNVSSDRKELSIYFREKQEERQNKANKIQEIVQQAEQEKKSVNVEINNIDEELNAEDFLPDELFGFDR